MRDGFIKVAAGTPQIRVADCRYNAEQIFTLMREADKQGVRVLALPELCLTGYTCGDLFLQDTLLRGAKEGLATILEATKHLDRSIRRPHGPSALNSGGKNRAAFCGHGSGCGAARGSAGTGARRRTPRRWS